MAMANTLVSTYDNFSAAENALNALLASGFQPANVLLTPEEDTGAMEGNPGLDAESAGNDRPGLFDEADGDAERIDSPISDAAMKRESYLLTVDTTDADEFSRASDIVNRCGALAISERTSIGKGEA
jgi:hypothetical protein